MSAQRVRVRHGGRVHGALEGASATLCGIPRRAGWVGTREGVTCPLCTAAARVALGVLLASQQGAEDETSQGVDTSSPCL